MRSEETAIKFIPISALEGDNVADRLGAAFLVRVLENLQAHYGDERYRISPALNRLRWGGGKFHS